MTKDPKYPDIEITIRIREPEGNAYAILGNCKVLMQENDIEKSEQDLFQKEATSSDYEALLATVSKWFNSTIYRY